MKNLTAIGVFSLAFVLVAGCGKDSSPQNQTANTPANSNSNNPTGYLDTLVQTKKKADKTIDVAYLNQAVQLFNVQEGRFPKDLQELAPKYVAQIPEPPAGYKLDYDAVKGEVKMVAQ